MKVIGIDLGTTYSSVGCLTGHGVQLVPDYGLIGVPSIVAFQNGEWQVGKRAQDYAWKYPKTTIYDLKRMFGYKYDHPTIQEFIRTWPFDVERGLKGEILIRIQEGAEVKLYRPCELSAKILEKLKKMAEGKLGEPVTEAVITVPANFNDRQREETKEAAKLAGLKILRLMNEPCAGAITYAYERPPTQEQNVMVFDLGGGTLDVSLLTIEGTRLSVQAVAGDIHLGGRDFDDRMMHLCLKRLDRTGSITIDSLEPKKLHQLRANAEEVKCELSDALRAIVCLDGFMSGQDLDFEITRDEFEDACQKSPSLYDRMLRIIDEVLFFSGKTVADVHKVILIGGGSKIPKVRRMIGDYMGKQPFGGTSPLEAVAKGATVFAGTLIKGCDIPDIREIECRDICPLALGTDLVGGRMGQVIPRGAQLPATGTCGRVTVEHNQTSMSIEVYEGPWKMVHRNRCLGSFTVDGLPPDEANQAKVNLTFKVDCDGVLTVAASAVAGGRTTGLTVAKTAHLFTNAKVSRTLQEYEAEKAMDAREFDEVERKTIIETLAKNFRVFLEQESCRDKRFDEYVPESERTRLLSLVNGMLPSALGRIPSRGEIRRIRKELQNGVSEYMKNCRNGIPVWLQRKVA
jgi:L1 cell adhesion molecule like protein